MPRPTARVLELLEILQSGGIRRVAELASRLGVDERTVRRYIDHLRALDIPVETLRGRHGGYRLASGFRMPPLMLTEEEALATVLALSRTRAEAPSTDTAAAGAAETALAKLRRAMPGPLADGIDAVLESTSFTSGGSADRIVADAPEAATLLRFARAAREGHPVEFRYEDREGRRSQRVLLPFGIVAHSGRWYVTGADSLSEETRTFRLDRIGFPRVLPETFEVPSEQDLAEAVRVGLAATPWRHQVSLRVSGTLEQVAGRLPAGIATVDPPDAGEEPAVTGWVRVRFRAERLDWVPSMLVRLGFPFVVEGPPALRELLAALAGRLGEAISPTSTRQPP